MKDPDHTLPVIGKPPINRDTMLTDEIDWIRHYILTSGMKKSAFAKAVARFCKAQDDDVAEPITAEEFREIISACLREQRPEQVSQ